MKPPALEEVSHGGKHGKVFPETIRGTRFPSNACWPNNDDICVMLTYQDK